MALLLAALAVTGTVMGTQYVSAASHHVHHHVHHHIHQGGAGEGSSSMGTGNG